MEADGGRGLGGAGGVAGAELSLFEVKKGRSQSLSAFPPRDGDSQELNEFKSKLEKAQVGCPSLCYIFLHYTSCEVFTILFIVMLEGNNFNCVIALSPSCAKFHPFDSVCVRRNSTIM